MRHRHKWGGYSRDFKNRRWDYRDIYVRQCAECKKTQYGLIKRN